MNPTGSFIRFTLGFLAFLGVSFAVTVTLDKYAASQESAQTATFSVSDRAVARTLAAGEVAVGAGESIWSNVFSTAGRIFSNPVVISVINHPVARFFWGPPSSYVSFMMASEEAGASSDIQRGQTIEQKLNNWRTLRNIPSDAEDSTGVTIWTPERKALWNNNLADCQNANGGVECSQSQTEYFYAHGQLPVISAAGLVPVFDQSSRVQDVSERANSVSKPTFIFNEYASQEEGGETLSVNGDTFYNPAEPQVVFEPQLWSAADEVQIEPEYQQAWSDRDFGQTVFGGEYDRNSRIEIDYQSALFSTVPFPTEAQPEINWADFTFSDPEVIDQAIIR